MSSMLYKNPTFGVFQDDVNRWNGHPCLARLSDTARAMSQENIEAFKRAVEANNRGDYEALLAEIDPDVEWHAVFQVMFGGQATVCRGHDGVREYLWDLDEGFDVRHVELSAFRDLG